MSLVSGDTLTTTQTLPSPRVVSGEWCFGAQMAAKKLSLFSQNTSQKLTQVRKMPPVMIQSAAAQAAAVHSRER